MNVTRAGRPMKSWLIVLAALAVVAPAEASAVTTAQLDSTASGNRTVGRLFVTNPTNTEKCTGAVVDAPNQSTIVTAGHCLKSATNGVALSARFVPGYHDGVAPFGEWNALQMVPAPQWDTANNRFDFAFIVAARNAQGVAVEDAVGALPIAFNQPRQQGYRIFGYPSQPAPPYDSQKLWACDTAWSEDVISDSFPGPPRIAADCDFGVGASGGPWLSAQGAVASVSSTSPPNNPISERGPYFGDEAAALFVSVKDVSTAPPAVAAKKCKKHKQRKKHAASAKKKKCKKKRRKR
jgi:V8-like Glu-specific endopeptidase